MRLKNAPWIVVLFLLTTSPLYAFSVSYFQLISANAVGGPADNDSFDSGDIMALSASHSATTMSDGTANGGGTAFATANGAATLGTLGINASANAQQDLVSQSTSNYSVSASATFFDTLTMNPGVFIFVFELSSEVGGGPIQMGGVPNVGVTGNTGAQAFYTISFQGNNTMALSNVLSDGNSGMQLQTMSITQSFSGGEEVGISGVLSVSTFGAASLGVGAESFVNAGSTARFFVIPDPSTPNATYTSESGASYIPVPAAAWLLASAIVLIGFVRRMDRHRLS